MSLIVHQMELVLDFSKSTVGSLLFTGSQGFVATVKPFSDNHAINNGKNVQPRGNYLRFGKSSTSWECGRDPAIFYYNSIGQLPWQHCQLFDRMWLTGYCSTWSLHHNRWTMNPAGKFESLVIRQPIDWIWTRCDFLSRHLATRLATPKVETFFNVDSNIQMFSMTWTAYVCFVEGLEWMFNNSFQLQTVECWVQFVECVGRHHLICLEPLFITHDSIVSFHKQYSENKANERGCSAPLYFDV